jgi:Rha family phage regulatory protein
MDLTTFISRHGEELVTDSRAVAIAFGKRHKNVVQTIARMRTSPRPTIAEHGELNFQPSTYTTVQGKTSPMYRMTADGLSELAMGFSGDDAREVRIRFIAAFRSVEQRQTNAERSVTQMLHEFEKRAIASESKGSIGSRLMNDRRREKPALQAEQSKLAEVAQPRLPGFVTPRELQ